MRDAGPLILDLLINDHILAEVIHDQTLIQLVQGGGVQSLAALDHRMCLALKFSKHCGAGGEKPNGSVQIKR